MQAPSASGQRQLHSKNPDNPGRGHLHREELPPRCGPLKAAWWPERGLALSWTGSAIVQKVMILVGHPEVLEEPWFATGRQRAQHADLLDAHVGSWIGVRTRAEVLTAFEEAGAAVAPVYKPSELLDDPQVRAMELVTSVPDEDLGTMRMQNVPWRMAATPGRIRSTGRNLGADTDAILAELGITPDRVAELRGRGIV